MSISLSLKGFSTYLLSFAIVSATVVVCTCLTSLSYSIVVLLFVVAKYSVHSAVVHTQDVGTHTIIKCVRTAVLERMFIHLYYSILARVLSCYTPATCWQN